jgi:hypothetical protein
LVDWQDINRWQMINRALGMAFNDPIETYSSSDHVYIGLGIEKGVTGKLPGAKQTREGLASEKLEDLGETGANKGRRPQTKNSSSSSKSNSGSSRNRPTKSAPVKSQSEKPAEAKAPREPRQRNRTRSAPKDA